MHIEVYTGLRRFEGTTNNVACLSLELSKILTPGAPLDVVLDGDKLSAISWPVSGKLYLYRKEVVGCWGAPLPQEQSAVRNGPFQEAFQHRSFLCTVPMALRWRTNCFMIRPVTMQKSSGIGGMAR